MQKIYSTKNYDIFESYYANRNLKLVQIEKSLLKHGWINAYPMHVVKNGGKTLKIKDGHHRFAAARRLGIPVKYVVCDDTATLSELIDATNNHTISDFLSRYVRMGKKEYIHIKNYHDQTKIPITYCIAFHFGNVRGNQRSQKAFTSGHFKIRNLTLPRDVALVVLHCKKLGYSFASEGSLACAIAKTIQVPGVTINLLNKKIEQAGRIFEKQYCIKDYMHLLERVYNNRNKKKLPIVFLADEISRKNSSHTG